MPNEVIIELAAGTADQRLFLWNATDGKPVAYWTINSDIRAFGSDGPNTVVAGKHDVTPGLRYADDAIIAAQRALWDRLRIAAEPGGAAALGALAWARGMRSRRH